MLKENEANESVKSLSKSMLVVMVFTMVAKVTGFLRETVLASRFGVSAITDSYKTAFDIPCIFLSVIVTALSATLIPSYSSQLQKGRDRADRFIRNLFTIGLALSAVILGLTLMMMETLVCKFFLPGASAEVQQLTIRLATIMLPMGFFTFLARMSTAYLQANFHFAIPAVSQVMLNVCIIVFIILSKGENIELVALGTLLGWVVQFVVQVPSLHKSGLRCRPVFDLKDPGVREVAVLMLPVLVSSAFDQVYIIVDRAVASGAAGNITALDYGNRISTMVSSVLLTSIATVLYPTLVKNVDSRDDFRKTLGFGINLNLLIAIPAIAALTLLRLPVTRLVYERGAFTKDNSLLTSGTLACYSCGILGVGLREIGNRCFYACKKTKIPTIIGIFVVLLNIGLDIAFYPVWGAAGIAAATAVSSTLSGLVLMFTLHRRLGAIDGKRLLTCLWKVLAATACMCGVLLALSSALSLSTATGRVFQLGMLATIAAGVAVYAAVLLLLKTEELRAALAMLRTKLRRG